MKKKIISIVIMMLIVISFPLTTSKAERYDRRSEQENFTNIMSTIITVGIYKEDDILRQQVLAEIGEMFRKYHMLTDNFKKYDINGYANTEIEYDSNNVINNVAFINENPNTKIKIDKDLYNILEISEIYKQETNGYFDVSIGILVDKWKKLINLPENKRLTDEEFDIFIEEVLAIPVIADGILLEEIADDYFVTIKDGVKIDLGAIAKGYIVELAADIIKGYGIVHFEVGGSDSSLHFGTSPDVSLPSREIGEYRIGITLHENHQVGDDYAAIVNVKNESVGSSGNVQQYYMHKGKKYHHIVSPITKMPENFRSLVTLIGPDAGKIDALTTALMNMDDEKMNAWALKNPEYKVMAFTESENEEQKASLLIPSILISVIVTSLAALVVTNYYSNKKKEQANEEES